MLHWVHDASCISYIPSETGYNQASFLAVLNNVGEKADVRKQLVEKTDVKDEDFLSGPLVSENKWKDWESNFANNLSTAIGIRGIPLSYIKNK